MFGQSVNWCTPSIIFYLIGIMLITRQQSLTSAFIMQHNFVGFVLALACNITKGRNFQVITCLSPS